VTTRRSSQIHPSLESLTRTLERCSTARVRCGPALAVGGRALRPTCCIQMASVAAAHGFKAEELSRSRNPRGIGRVQCGRRSLPAVQRRRDKASPRRPIAGRPQGVTSIRRPVLTARSRDARSAILKRPLGPRTLKNLAGFWCPGAESNHRHGDFQSLESPSCEQIFTLRTSVKHLARPVKAGTPRHGHARWERAACLASKGNPSATAAKSSPPAAEDQTHIPRGARRSCAVPRRRRHARRKQYVLRAPLDATVTLTSALRRRIRLPLGAMKNRVLVRRKWKCLLPAALALALGWQRTSVTHRATKRRKLDLPPGRQRLDQFLLTGWRTGTRKGVVS